MVFHKRIAVYNAIYQTKLVPLFYHSGADVAQQIISSCYQGGARVVEFTNRGDFALDVFAQLRRYCAEQHPDMILGIGSVIDAPTAALFLQSGAEFIVGPSFNPDIAMLCNRRKVAYIPGCATPTEIAQAEAYGAELVKVFPSATVGGSAFVKSILGPSPWTSIMATGGVKATREDITSWFAAGVACVGMGSQLISNVALEQRAYDQIVTTVRQVRDWIDDATHA